MINILVDLIFPQCVTLATNLLFVELTIDFVYVAQIERKSTNGYE